MRLASRVCLAFIPMAMGMIPVDAAACNPGQCLDSWGLTAPREGQVIPASAPALVLRTWLYPEGGPFDQSTRDFPDAGFTLTALSGAAPTFTLEEGPEGWLLIPDAPLAAGAGYLLEYDSYCAKVYQPNRLPPHIQVAFTTGPDVPLPADLPAVELKEMGVAELSPTAPTCGVPQGRIAWASLSISAGADMEPWLPLIGWETRVDGAPWALMPYGQIETETLGETGPRCGRLLRMVYAQCDGPGDGSVAPGARQVTVVARLAGTTLEFESAPLSITFECGVDGGTTGLDYSSACGDHGACPHGYCCIAAGQVCQFKDQCCDGNPCVPDNAGILRCTSFMPPADSGVEEPDAGEPGGDAGATADAGSAAVDAGTDGTSVDPGRGACTGCGVAGGGGGALLVLLAALANRRRRPGC